MSISHQAKDDKILGLQLKVQELCVVEKDPGVSISGASVVIKVGEVVAEVRCALHCDASGPSVELASAAITGAGSDQITVTLPAAYAAGDSVIVKYAVAETLS